jgi:hypothetical protein
MRAARACGAGSTVARRAGAARLEQQRSEAGAALPGASGTAVRGEEVAPADGWTLVDAAPL